jgi:hypothetical protein
MCPPGVYAYEIEKRSKRIFERVNNNNILNNLFNLFKKYSNSIHELLIGATICYFHSYEELRPEMWIIIDLMKKTLEEYSCGKTTIKTNDIIFILNSLRVISRSDNNLKRLFELKFSFLLLKVISDNNFTIVQYALLLFGGLTFFFSSEDAKQLVSSNAFNIFSDLFKRLTFTTSTVPVPFVSLDSALCVIKDILSSDSTCVELFLNIPLIQTIMNMLPLASLVVCGAPLPQIKYIIIDIANILGACGNSMKNIENLFNFDFITLLLKTFEMIGNEREKGKTEFDDILCEVSGVFYNLSVKGSNMPNSNNENSFSPSFQKINTIEKLNDLFIRLKKLNSPSVNLRNCLNYLTLFVCFLFRGRTPPVSFGPVLEHCDKMRKLQKPAEGYKFPEAASISWNNMVNPENVLAECKKK